MEIKNSINNETMEILIDGMIGDSEGITVEDAQDIIQKAKDYKEIKLLINSPGGYVFEGWSIFNLLSNVKDKITVEVIGLAASMASVLALVGSKMTMRKGSMFMIHAPWSIAMGDSKTMRLEADILDKIKEDMKKLYLDNSALNEKELDEMIEKETWLNADETLFYGFADAIDEQTLAAAACIDNDKFRFKNMPEIYKAKKDETKQDKLNELEQVIKDMNERLDKIQKKDSFEETINIKDKEKIMDNEEKTLEAKIQEEVGKVLAKTSAGRALEGNESKNTLDKSFVDYVVTKGKESPKATSVKTSDGYGVPTLVDEQVFKRRSVGSLMRKEIEGVDSAKIRKYSADTKVTAKINPVAAIIAEGADYVNSSDAGSAVTFDSIKMGAIYAATEEVAEESVINFVDDFSDDAGKALAILENGYFFTGTGSAQPQGIVTGGTVAVTTASASAITYDELVNLDESMPSEYSSGAVYFMSGTTRAYLRKLKDTTNKPILQEYNAGLFSLFGKPVVINSNVAAIAGSAKVIVLANRAAYGIGDRASGLKIRVSENTSNGDTEVRWSLRTDGKVLDATAFQILQMKSS